MGYILRFSLCPPPIPAKKTQNNRSWGCSFVVGHLDSNPSNKHTRLMTILFVSDLSLSGLPRLAFSS